MMLISREINAGGFRSPELLRASVIVASGEEIPPWMSATLAIRLTSHAFRLRRRLEQFALERQQRLALGVLFLLEVDV